MWLLVILTILVLGGCATSHSAKYKVLVGDCDPDIQEHCITTSYETVEDYFATKEALAECHRRL